MKNTTIIFLCVWQISLSYGQSNSNWDSLKQELVNAKSDTTRVLIYEKMIWASPNDSLRLVYGYKGINLAKKIRFYRGAALCGNSLGFLTVEKDYYQAIDILSETKQICERSNNEYELAKTLSYLGYAYDKFDFQHSLNYYRESKKIMTRLKIPESVIPINSAIGYSFKEQGKLDSALVYLQKGYEYALKIPTPIPPNSFYMHFGEVYYKKKEPDIAMIYFRRSIDSLKNSEFVDGQAYAGIAKIYRDRNQIDSAILYAKNALQIQEQKNRTIYIIESANLLFELYQNSNPAEALKYHLIVSETKDKLFSQEKVAQAEKLVYEEREREARIQRRIEAREAEVQSKIKIYLLSGILLVLGIFSFILFRNNKNKQKANTLLKRQKDEIKEKSDQLEISLETLKSTQAQLIQSEKMASLGELTAGIAHEIQNPLNFVNNFSELSNELISELKVESLKDESERDKGLEDEILNDIAQNLTKINHHGKRASDIVKGMLEHSRTTTGQKEPTDINALADEYLRLAYHGLRAKHKEFNATMKTDFDESIGNINIIPQDIGRVILNLITNAFYAVNEKSKQNIDGYQPIVTITTCKAAEGIMTINKIIKITVKDNGNGIPYAIKDKIFQPFFTTKPTGQGTGLGLSLSYDIVKAHGGELKVESKEGQGSEFVITFPINT